MNFAVLGGDGRSACLVGLLREDGHRVRHFALERALPDGAESAAAAVAGADAIILPLPAQRGEALFAPFAAVQTELMEALRTAAPGTPVLAGNAGEVTVTACGALGLPLRDYFREEAFIRRNALLTAEAALALLRLRGAGIGTRILIAGFGRIGSALAKRCRAAGMAVTAAARSEQARQAARGCGCSAVAMEDAPAPGYDFAVNTVPAVIFGKAEIAAFKNAELIELASPPYGFDLAAATELGREVTIAAGLPGRFSPEAAAGAIRDVIYDLLEA